MEALKPKLKMPQNHVTLFLQKHFGFLPGHMSLEEPQWSPNFARTMFPRPQLHNNQTPFTVRLGCHLVLFQIPQQISKSRRCWFQRQDPCRRPLLGQGDADEAQVGAHIHEDRSRLKLSFTQRLQSIGV